MNADWCPDLGPQVWFTRIAHFSTTYNFQKHAFALRSALELDTGATSQLGMNYAQWLRLGVLKPSNKAADIPVDFTEQIVVQLPSDDWYAKHCADLGANAEAALKPKSVVEMKVAGLMADCVPIIKVIDPKCDLGGSVQMEMISPEPVINSKLAPNTESLSAVQQGVTKMVGGQQVQGIAQSNCTLGQLKCRAEIKNSTEALNMFDSEDALKVQDKGFISDGTETFVRICKELALPFEEHRLYRQWLVEYKGVCVFVLPTEAYSKVPAGVRFDYPSGSRWREIVGLGSRKHKRANHLDFDDNQIAVDKAFQWIEDEIHRQKPAAAEGGQYAFNVQRGMRAMMTGLEF
jgi:hypothetical protein